MRTTTTTNPQKTRKACENKHFDRSLIAIVEIFTTVSLFANELVVVRTVRPAVHQKLVAPIHDDWSEVILHVYVFRICDAEQLDIRVKHVRMEQDARRRVQRIQEALNVCADVDAFVEFDVGNLLERQLFDFLQVQSEQGFEEFLVQRNAHNVQFSDSLEVSGNNMFRLNASVLTRYAL